VSDESFNLPYYVTDFLHDGVDRRTQDGLFDPEEAVRIAIQVCEALEALHSEDPPLFHLDLNPANIRLAEDGSAIVTDFGLMRRERVQHAVTTTLPQWLPPIVMAPEQIAGSDQDGRTDIYQVGALLFHMLTGKNRVEFGVMVLVEDRPDSPRSLATIIEQCTRNNKDLRFQDVTSLKNALAHAKQSWFHKYIVGPYLVTKAFLSTVEAQVPPVWQVWRSTAAWIFAAFFVLALSWAVGWIFPPTPIKITIASSSTKKEWLIAAVNSFYQDSRSDRRYQLSGFLPRLIGQPIEVEILLEEVRDGDFSHYRSGTMIRDILSDDSDRRHIEPTIASPADQSYIRRLRKSWSGSTAEKQWSAKLGRDLSADDIVDAQSPDLLATPLIIAMWESHAVSLGCWPTPVPSCSWKTLASIASAPDGWGKVGHPERGALQYGMGAVGKSNSATITQVLICMAGAGKRSGLVLTDVLPKSPCGDAMVAFNQGDIVFFEKSEWALVEMQARGPEFLDAVTTYEEEVIELNREGGATRGDPIVAVYPQDGTVQPTHPFAILRGAPWVEARKAEAAQVFLDYLLSFEQQLRLAEQGFRPVHPDVAWGDEFRRYGATPDANLVLVDLPEPDVIDAVVNLWECIRGNNCP
jgi:serine/threonine protein kinase